MSRSPIELSGDRECIAQGYGGLGWRMELASRGRGLDAHCAVLDSISEEFISEKSLSGFREADRS